MRQQGAQTVAMRAKLLFAIALAGMLAAPLPAVSRPVTASQTLQRACAGRDGWSDPAPPQRIFANTWYVGTCGISAVLVTSPQGHVLIDAGPAEAADTVAHNIVAAGFRLADVRWIVMSHEHIDHAGGLAALKRMTGARLAALPAAARVLESGQVPADDPQSAWLKPFPAVAVDRRLRDGETLTVGPLRLTVHATPGHAPARQAGPGRVAGSARIAAPWPMSTASLHWPRRAGALPIIPPMSRRFARRSRASPACPARC
jgi:metallo-beta-lactamase class B